MYGPDGEKIGAIERVMVDKISGKVSCAVLSFGGFTRHRATIITRCPGNR